MFPKAAITSLDLSSFKNTTAGEAGFGYCSCCKTEHSFFEGTARQHCLELMQQFEEKKRIDLLAADQDADPKFSTDYLFGEARGQMFAVMVCREKNGTLSLLRAFSCQYNGEWEVDGWVPPLFDVNEFKAISYDVEREIKKIGREIDLLDTGSSRRQRLAKERKSLSQKLMKDIHSLYRLTNFRGETKSLYKSFYGADGIPTGTGDCCAPKLLNYAAQNGFTPLGLAEFYWGKENRSATRQHGNFYPACQEKCQPILGFLLCGLEEKLADY